MGTSHSKGKKSKSHKSKPAASNQQQQQQVHDTVTASSSNSNTSPVVPENVDNNTPTTNNENEVEAVVCKETDVKENEMKVFDIDDDGNKVLIVKQNGKISALGTKCTHYGAPLVNGALGDGRVRCQWHGACFNITTGDIEDFPGLDSLPCYKVTIVDGDVKVRASKEQLKSQKRIKGFAKCERENTSCYVVAGGGAAGSNCVETLRQEGYQGRVVLISKENCLPYDRIKLSKALDSQLSKITLRSEEYYKERDIEIKKGVEVVGVDSDPLSVTLSDGNKMACDKLFLATGSSARMLPIPGSELKNVFVLRTIDDANNIHNTLTPESNVVILGSSFIGLEAAAFMVGKVKSITVVAIEPVPFALILGTQLGARIKALFEERGVRFYQETGIKTIQGTDKVESTVLSNGTEIPADLVVVGVGAVPNTNFLKDSGVSMLKNGTIPVNEYLETNVPNIFAGGDIATAPVLGTNAAIGHWGLANYHGHIAGKNMAGHVTPVATVPFFWTVLFGKSFRYTGFCPDFDEVIIRGSVEELKFIAYYCQGNKVGAVCTINSDPAAAKFAEFLQQGKKITRTDIDNLFE